MRDLKSEKIINYVALDLTYAGQHEILYCFGRWLNDYFEPWNPDEGTWIDSEQKAFNTDELVEEFLKLTTK